MVAPLEPAEVVRRLTALRDMHESHLAKDIAEHLGLTATNFVNWSRAYDIEQIDEHLEAAIADLNDDDAILRQAVELDQKHKHRSKAAQEMGVSWQRFTRLLDRAADRGLDGSTPVAIPRGQVVKGISTMSTRNPETGEWQDSVVWTKTKQDASRAAEAFEIRAQELAKTLPAYPATEIPEHGDDDLLDVLTLTDAHIGSLATMSETGNSWKVREAERVLTGAFSEMVKRGSGASTAVVAFLGDTMDYDGLIPVTPSSGHVLDSDSRFGEMVRSTVRVQRFVLQAALSAYDKVYFLDAEANHDPASSTHRRVLWSEVYRNEPRLQVIESDLPYYAISHGKVMLAWHHGHLTAKENLPGIFADEFPDLWACGGRETKRYCHIGHLHKRVEDGERRGMDIIVHPTLAGRNAWAARSGFRSMRRARCYTYHREFGEVASFSVSPEMLEHAA